ncbi:MAG: hypothetical protein WDZ59_04855 [Pirellulales bacterium]
MFSRHEHCNNALNVARPNLETLHLTGVEWTVRATCEVDAIG